MITPHSTTMYHRLAIPGVTFFLASALGLLQMYYAIRGPGWSLALWALGYGLLLGAVVQSCVSEVLPWRKVVLGPMLGSGVLWNPVVLATYGFALMAAPIFFAYAASTLLGARLALFVRRRCASARAV